MTRPLTDARLEEILALVEEWNLGKFIPAARRAIPDLVDEVRRLRESLVQKSPGLSRIEGENWLICRFCHTGWQESGFEKHRSGCDSPRNTYLLGEGGEDA